MHIFLALLSFASGLVFHPTFNSCAVDSLPGVSAHRVEYCSVGHSDWKESAFGLNIVGLEEDTEYSVRYFDGAVEKAAGSFRTWRSDVPVARTIFLNPDEFKAPYVIDCKGSEDGWIRITSSTGKLFNPGASATFIVRGAQYVLIDDMELRGAADAANVIKIENSSHVRVRNCDIAGWGTSEYVPMYSLLPKDDKTGAGLGRYRKPDGKPINYQAAIRVGEGSSCVVIERCYIHDPLSRSCSWYYCHPAGPEAVLMACPDHSTVIRWCDFVGADGRNWNDAVEGARNFKEDGGFNRDADIYGNFMIFANDDCIELDGGQKNIRCFENRFESSLCGVSVQGCMLGPSYVYNNLFSGKGEQFGMTGATVKTAPKNGWLKKVFVNNNLMWGDGTEGLTFYKSLVVEAVGNVFCGEQRISGRDRSPLSKDVDNRYAVRMDVADLPAAYPIRPLPFVLSRARVDVGLSRDDVIVDIIGEVPDGTKVVMPDAVDWLDAAIQDGKLVVKFKDGKMRSRRNYRAALLVRTPEGLSRPLSIYATTDFVPPLEPNLGVGDRAYYSKEFALRDGGSASVKIKVTRAGRYWLMLHGKAKEFRRRSYPVFELRKDGEFLGKCIQQSYEYPTWSMVAPGQKPIGTMVYHFDLVPGTYTFQLSSIDEKSFEYDRMVLTTNPELFEPNHIPSR